jgi:hypothetical protein
MIQWGGDSNGGLADESCIKREHEMSKTKRTERETKEHIAMLECTAEEAELKLIAAHEAKDKAECEAKKTANYLAMRAHEHVKRVKAARALIAELDVYTDAGVVIQQTTQIVDILLKGARDLSFQTWVRSEREGPNDHLTDDDVSVVKAKQTTEVT